MIQKTGNDSSGQSLCSFESDGAIVNPIVIQSAFVNRLIVQPNQLPDKGCGGHSLGVFRRVLFCAQAVQDLFQVLSLKGGTPRVLILQIFT